MGSLRLKSISEAVRNQTDTVENSSRVVENILEKMPRNAE